MRRLALAAAIVLLVGLATTTRAEEKNFGVGLKLGYHNFVRYNPADDPNGNGALEDGEIDYAIDSGAFDGLTIEADFEYRFHPNFTLAGGFQWYGARVNVNALADENYVQGDIALSVTALTVTPKFVLPVSIVNLYTGAGVGLYWRVLGTSYTVTDAQRREASQSSADSQGQLGYHALIGFEVLPRDWIGIVMEDRFAFVHFKGQDPVSNLDDTDEGGNSVFLGTRFHF